MKVDAIVPQIVTQRQLARFLLMKHADAVVGMIASRVEEHLGPLMRRAEKVCPGVTKSDDFQEVLREVCEPGAVMVWPGGEELIVIASERYVIWRGRSSDFERHHLSMVADYLGFLVHQHGGMNLTADLTKVLHKQHAPVIGWLAKQAA